MKESNGNTQWGTRWLRRILIFGICLTVILALYDRYLSGSIDIDAGLINQDNLNLIAENWDALEARGMFVDWNEDGNAETHLLRYAHPTYTGQTVDMVFTILVTEAPISSMPNATEIVPDAEGIVSEASYERKGIVDALYGLYQFGECTSHFTVYGERCVIAATFYNSSGTSKEFDEIMREILAVLSQSGNA